MRGEHLRIGGEVLDRLLDRNRALLVGQVLQRLVREIPDYQRLPSEQLLGDITAVTEYNLTLFVELARSGCDPQPDAVRVIRESAARRAEEGIPVDAVLTAYQVGAQVVWEFVGERVAASEIQGLIAANMLLLRWLRAVTGAVVSGYLEETQQLSAEQQVARQAVFAALLGGTDVDSVSGLAGIQLPDRYIVLSLTVGKHVDEALPDVDVTVAARRKLRRLSFELQRQVPELVLSEFADSRGTALIPLTERTEVDIAWVRRLIAEVARAADADVTAGVAVAPPARVQRAAELATDIRDLATLIGRPPGAYQLDDVLLEYQLSRPSFARDRLAARFDPLDQHPDLEETLAVFLRHGRARRSTASELHLHPNTVDYRLRKIATLTGLDPMDATHTAMIEAALIARAARAGR